MRLGIVYHSNIYKDSDGVFIKELWGKYFDDCFVPIFDKINLLTPLSKEKTFQQFKCNENIRVFLLETNNNRFQIFWKNIKIIYDFVNHSDLFWIFLPTYKALLVCILSIFQQKPYIAYVGGTFFYKNKLKKLLYGFIEFFIIAYSNKCLIRDNNLKNKYKQLSQKMVSAAPAISVTYSDIEIPEQAEIWPPSIINLLYVGALNDAKGIQDLLKSIQILDVSNIQVNLNIVGVGEKSEEYKHLVKSMNLENGIIFHGYIENGQKLYNFYKQADLFILPSYSEGFPRVLIESAVFGAIPLTTTVGGISEMFQNEINCMTINVGEPEDIAKKVTYLINNPVLYRRLRTNLFKTAKSALEQNYIQQIQRLFAELQIL